MNRTLGCAGFVVVGCNAIVGNDERILADSTSSSGAGGTGVTSGSAGSFSAGGSGGSRSHAGGSAGAAGANDGGGAGESSAASAGGVGGATSTTTGGPGTGTSSTGTSSTSTSSTTGAPCECTPGDTDPIPQQTACGKCGTASATRSCGEDCRWGPYGEPGACTNEGVCTPNEPGERVGHCTNGRWRNDARTCGSDCQWGAWVEGECQGNASNCTGCACVSYCTHPDTGGTTCLWIGCTEAEGRAECDEDVEATCGARKEPFEFIEWLPN
ncbi:MAG TPA: hypothetical protein VI197_19600 [Polyangiaceae bacterium]